ncbi:MAG: ABC transporter permease [Capnocytophaga sp.]|nr:ABC transporter permease [Capnocytophaga sp.]
MLKNWLHTFIYHTRKELLFSVLNLLGLAIGIAGVIFAILYWNDEHSYDRWNPQTAYIYQSTVTAPSLGGTWASTPAPFGTYVQEIDGVEAVCFTRPNYTYDLVMANGKKEMLDKIVDAENRFFEFFPFPFVYGSPETAIEPNSIVLEESVAKRFFGDENPVGKTVRYGSSKELTVKGIYQIPGNTSFMPEAVINEVAKTIEYNKDSWGNYNFSMLIKIENSERLAFVNKRMNAIFYENVIVRMAKEQGVTVEEFKKEWPEMTFSFEPLAEARLHSDKQQYPEGRGNYQFLLILSGVSVLILVLSVVNYINLATASAIKRAKEVGIRKIAGASRLNIVLQFIFETLIVTLFAILVALSVVELLLPSYNLFLNKEIVLNSRQFFVQLAILLCIVVATAGIFPAMYISDFQEIKVLKGNFGRSKSGTWLRNAMLVLQFAIASFFIICSYTVYQQVQHLTNKNLGFSGDQILRIRYQSTGNNSREIYERYETVKQELLKINGVEGVGTGPFTFGSGANSSSGFGYQGTMIQAQNIAVDFDMLDLLKIKVTEGRNLNPDFASDTVTSMLINETTRRLMGEKDPIGKQIDWNDRTLTVVGVVDDFSLYSPQSEVPPMVFFHLKTVDWMIHNINYIYVKANASDMQQALASLENFWINNVNSDYPFEYDFVDKAYARTYENYVKQQNLFGLLNFVVILIAVFGLFSLASYSIQRRMKGIAIRKTLGANTLDLLKNLSVQYLIFCIIGFLLAVLPSYYVLMLWLENFSYRIDISLLAFAVSFLVMTVLTLAVVLLRAYRATKVDMLKYLKYE